MYKVFVNHRVIFFADDFEKIPDLKETELQLTYDGRSTMELTVDVFLKNSSLKQLAIIHSDVEELFEEFSGLYKKVLAAGGLVTRNSDKAVLMIFRNGKWDIPKGKLEENEKLEECALREVEEECGIKNIKLNKPLSPTWHMYEMNGETVLKETHWYEMSWDEGGQLKPQKEEGIEKVEWMKNDELKKARDSTYASLKDMLGAYL